MVKDLVHHISRILKQSIFGSTLDIRLRPHNLLVAFARWIRIRRAPVLALRSEDTGICDVGEVRVVTASLQHDHVGKWLDVVELDMVLVYVAIDLAPSST